MPSHGLRFDVNCSILFTELPVLARPAAAKAAGFDAVEFWWPFPQAVPADAEVDAFVAALADAGVELVGLNFFAGDMPAGDRGLVSWPGREQEFRDNVALVAAIGERTGCRTFNALYGNRIGGDGGADAAAQDDLAAEQLAFAADAVARMGGTVVVESISGPQPYPLRTAADAFAVIDRADRDNIAFLADLYHLSVNGDDLSKVIGEYAARVGHVQIADAPGRHEPGTGELDLDAHLAALEHAGYGGWVGLEYTPSGPSADSFAWLSKENTT
ncbi:MAG: hydroxypyruvate isomerase family protein [Actinophytocola sp.]|uniref:hydroxypyruvate isomerase family protein n=1 Tax=Actinophytocola sp. TaxID=1872138 RepID=UPI003D6B4237